MSHKPDYDRGRDDAFRWCVTWLHKRANEMNDPHAKALFNTAAFHLGVEINGPKISPAHALAAAPTKDLSAGATTSPGTVGKEGPAQTGAGLAEAIEALRPFAKAASDLDPHSDDVWDALGVTIKVGDLRRARSVIAKLDASQGAGP